MIPPVAAVEILIVEDHPRHAELLRDELELEIPGAIVTHAGCVADARDTASGRTFDLVILDFRLPDGDGLEILREFRAAGRDEPIVFVTTSAAASTAVQAMKLGAADYVVKEEGYLAIVPFVVRDVLERSRLRRERAELERRLERAEQAAELHKLTAGIAHNLNNPLTTVRT
ncbi:MAG: response regulator, partial [Deltaproteobacteria bacterium]